MIKNTSHYDVFVSYAKEDSDFAKSLVKALKARNISVWYDQGELRLGNSVLRHIEDGLEHSDFFLLLLSPEYFKKPWTEFERGVALGRGGKSRILPVFLKRFKPKELVKIAPSIAETTGIEAEKYSLEEIASMISNVIKSRNERNGDELASR
jgi:hypothetical protein